MCMLWRGVGQEGTSEVVIIIPRLFSWKAGRTRAYTLQAESAARRKGHCGETEFGDFDCSADESGAWRISSLRDRTLAGCVAQCACCDACRYVSFAPARDDCSWYSRCDRWSRPTALDGAHERGTETVEMMTKNVPF